MHWIILTCSKHVRISFKVTFETSFSSYFCMLVYKTAVLFYHITTTEWFCLLDILLMLMFLNYPAVPGRWCEPVLLACAWSIHSVSIGCNRPCPAPSSGCVNSRCSTVTGLGVSHSTRTSCNVPFRLFSSTFVSQFIMGNIWTILPLAVSHSAWNSNRLCFTYFAEVGIFKSCRSSDINLADAETGKVCICNYYCCVFWNKEKCYNIHNRIFKLVCGPNTQFWNLRWVLMSL